MLTQVTATPAWRQAFPGAQIGLLLVSGADNTHRSTPLDEHKSQLETHLRQRYAGMQRADLLELEVLKAYRAYYKRFDKTYHVQLQLESLVLAGKSLPAVSPLVDACFAAELDSLILTASHDANRLQPPVSIDVSTGLETFTQLNGTTRTLKAGDMIMRDAEQLVCSVLYGQEPRSAISAATTSALYVSYVPAGVPQPAVQAHLDRLLSNIRLFAPWVDVIYQTILNG